MADASVMTTNTGEAIGPNGRKWNTKFNKDMLDLGFTRSKADPCVHYCVMETHITIVTVWVDNLILSTDNQLNMDRVQGEIEWTFDSKDLRTLRFILGIEIDYAPNEFKIKLRQTAYITLQIQDGGVPAGNYANEPKQCTEEADNRPWRRTRIFRYLKGTMDLRLTYGGEHYWSDVMEGYMDADWALNEDPESEYIAGSHGHVT
ncbi:hypothetical protein FRC01_012955 [Tulasnella sp. 417]|nr:hypothetical protein FRC01_012955 [Tulasnella sp. 417]